MIIRITLVNYREYIVVADSINSACKELLKYLNEKDLFFSSERKIKELEILAEGVDDYANIFKEVD